MKELTRREISKAYRLTRPPEINLLACILGLLFEIFMPGVALFAGILVIKEGLYPLAVLVIVGIFPVVLGIGLYFFRGIVFSTIREVFSVLFFRCRIVFAQCVNEIHTVGTGDYPDTHSYIFKADDKSVEVNASCVPKGKFAYLAVVNGNVIAVFDANLYYSNNFHRTFDSSTRKKRTPKYSAAQIIGIGLLEWFIVGAVTCDVTAVMTKQWVLALSSALFIVFHLLGANLGKIHAKFSNYLGLCYLLVNGLLIIGIAHLSSKDTAAYIVGGVFILLFIIIISVYYKIKNKKESV